MVPLRFFTAPDSLPPTALPHPNLPAIMNWLSNNYEKAALGGAALAALGLATLGWVNLGTVQQACFGTYTPGTGNNDPAIANAERVSPTATSPARPGAWTQATTAGRGVNLFTSVPLFIDRRHPDRLLDLHAPGTLHQPIPNTWWEANHLVPEFGDSPSRDPDGDGFSNLEEYTGGTDPNNPAAHPPLINKLMFRWDESIEWVVRPGFTEFVQVADQAVEVCPFTYIDSRDRRNRQRAVVRPGELFFAAGDAATVNRFKFLRTVRRVVVNPRIQQQMQVTFARFEDQKTNKKGRIYEKRCGFPEAKLRDFAEWDRSAVVCLEAVGGEGKPLTIEENTRFGLPLDSPDKTYLMKTITPESIEVEYPDPITGAAKTVTIRKGGFAQPER